MQITLTFQPNWELVEPIGDLIRSAARLELVDPSAVEQLSVACRELVENTVKYSANGDATVSLLITGSTVQLTVENHPQGKALRTLLDEVVKLAAVDDSLALYVQRMRIAAKNADTSKSGLGLARIRHECGMAISAERLDKRVRIVAKRAR